jgi:hypothetical protein
MAAVATERTEYREPRQRAGRGPAVGLVKIGRSVVDLKRAPATSPHTELCLRGRQRGRLVARGRGRYDLFIGDIVDGTFAAHRTQSVKATSRGTAEAEAARCVAEAVTR